MKTMQPPSYCAAPWVEGILYANGEMRPCCLSVSVQGDWQKDGLAQVWHSKFYQEFRKKIVEGNFPEDNCRRCCNNHYNRHLEWGLGIPFQTYMVEISNYCEKELPLLNSITKLFTLSPGDTSVDIWQPLLLSYDSEINRLGLLWLDAPKEVQVALHKLGVIGIVTRSFFEQSLVPPVIAPHREAQLIARCNARCIQCPGKHTGVIFDGPVMAEEYLPEAFTRPEDIVNFFNNGSEFLLYKGWKDVAAILAKAGTKISLSTNSILLTPRNIEHLVDNRLLLSANISIDGATKKTVEKIRVNVNFDNMMRGIGYLCEYGTQKDCFFPISFSFVLMKDNYHELPELVRLIESFKLKYPGFQYLINVQMLVLTDVVGYREFVYAQHPAQLDKEKFTQVFRETLKESQRTGTSVHILRTPIEQFVSDGCPVPQLLDPLMFLEKGSGEYKGFSMKIGVGWYQVEAAPVPARWVNDKVEVLFLVERDQECTLHMTISSFDKPRVCRITFAGQDLLEKEIGLDPEVLSVPLALKKGRCELFISSLDGADSPLSIKKLQSLDDRTLAFHLRGFEVVLRPDDG